MISKLRKLNAALKELGHRGVLITLDYKTPKTYSAVSAACLAEKKSLVNRAVDVGYDTHSPLELTYITYEEFLNVWTQTSPGGITKETEFATISFGEKNSKTTQSTKRNPISGNIEVNEEFVDLALEQTLEKVKEKYRSNIIEELVNARLKDAGLV